MFNKRRLMFGGAATVVILAAAAGADWWFFAREDAQLATRAPAIPADLVAASSTIAPQTSAAPATPAGATAATSSTATGASAAGSTQAFTIISDRSEAAYFAGEKLASLPLPSTAKGSTSALTGAFYLTADGLNLDSTHASTFTVDLTTLKSDKNMRDQRVQNQGLDTSQYPTATFTATSVSGYNASIPQGQEQTLLLTGILDLHGMQKQVTWDVKARREANVVTALATLNVKYADFNISQLNIANFVSVDDNVTLQVQIVAQAAS